MIESNDHDPVIQKFERFLDKMLVVGWVGIAFITIYLLIVLVVKIL